MNCKARRRARRKPQKKPPMTLVEAMNELWQVISRQQRSEYIDVGAIVSPDNRKLWGLP